ncbi:MAG: hypothetical protein M9942_00080 [Microthrixaceae bacterium]|nr:hypothetical protein [Microthrixaceae bacterium]
MTTSVITLSSEGVSVFQRSVCSTTPIAIAAAKATGMDSMRAMIAAARAGSSSAGPRVTDGAMPRLGARSTSVSAANRPASAQTSVVSRRTGMPSRRARSVFSAAARMPWPARLRCMNHARAPTTTGTTARGNRSLPSRITGPSCTVSADSGVSKGATIRGTSPKARSASSSSMPPNSWASPIVATVSTNLGAFAKRLITASSTRAPTARPTTGAHNRVSQ